MTSPFPCGPQITLIRRIPVENTDAYGDEDVAPSEESVQGAFDPGGGFSEQGDTTDTRPAVLLPPGTDVDLNSFDAVKVGGVTYEVDGPPQVWTSPFTGQQFGIRVPLKAQLRRPA